MPTIRQAIIFSSAARYSMKFIALASTMLVSRLLTPDEIGTFAIASAIVMIMSEFRMLGAGGYLIREDDLTEEKVRTALGLTLIISWGIGITILSLAYPVSRFYDLPPLAIIFSILSISFFIAPYISIASSLFARNLEFKIQFRIRLVASIVGFITTIGFILMGFSYYSLAIGHSSLATTQFIMMMIYKPERMVLMPAFRRMGTVAKFGVFNSLANFLRKATVTLPDMVIGKMGTIFQVGMFSRGLGLVEFVSQTLMMGITPVALPYLSNTRRDGGNVARAYIHASILLGALVIPVLGVVSLASLPAIRLFFGPQWDAAAPIASVLGLWGMLRCVHWLSNDLLMASGMERVMVVKEALVFSVLLPGIIFGFPFGLVWVAAAFLVAGVFEIFLTTYILHKVICLPVKNFVSSWWSTVVVTGACMLVTWGISHTVSFDTEAYWKPIILIALVLPGVWLGTLALCRHPLFFEIWAFTGSRRVS